jgi:proline dehydrogenase
MAAFMNRYGMKLGVGRFVAGKELTDAIATTGKLNAIGIKTSINHLGEAIESASGSAREAELYAGIYEALGRHEVDADASVKLTHLGLVVDPEQVWENVSSVARVAASHGNSLWLDMEESTWVDATLDVYRRLREEGYANTFLALQAYLHRTESDLRSLLPLAPKVRLVKGAYLEKPSIAYQEKTEIDGRFAQLMETSLREAAFTAIATHDDRLIDRAIALAQRDDVPRDRFEFQMMYGVREPLQRDLAQRGFSVRVIVSFGEDWYRFYLRRLAERPANVLLILRSLAGR